MIKTVSFCVAVVVACLGVIMTRDARCDDQLNTPIDGGQKRFNVLLIAVDDLNDWIGCLGGHPQAFTPHLDDLARRGILFSNAHCPATACNPSRAAIFSGRWPWQTGVWNNQSKRLFAQQPDIEVFPRWFQKHGYQTKGAGKLMHSSGAANRQMFQVSFNPEQRWSPFTKESVRYLKSELPSKGSANPLHPALLPTGDRVNLPLNRMPSDRKPMDVGGESFDWGGLAVEDEAMGDTRITDWAMDQLSQMNADQPFLLSVGYYRPHIPLFAPKKYFERFTGIDVTLPKTNKNDLDDLGSTGRALALEAETAGLHSTVLKYKQWSDAVRAYLACTTFVDKQIGRLLDSFNRSAYADDTIIVMFSDHGWHLGEKQHWGKWTGWERSTRVPLMIIPPRNHSLGSMDLGEICRTPVNLIDLYPTLCDLCEIAVPSGMAGESLRPLMHDVESDTLHRSSLTVFDRGNYSLRDQRYRFIQYADGSEELYDLVEDPSEWQNLSGSKDLSSVLIEFRNELATFLPGDE